jgi:hypothetical protein
MSSERFSFSARIYKVGINPCVDVPPSVTRALGRRGYIPVRGTVNGSQMRSTFVPKGGGSHRLYLNMDIRRRAGADVGDEVSISLEVDTEPRVIPVPEPFAKALEGHPEAKLEFDKLTPSRRKEILAYLNSLKTPEALERIILKVINQLLEQDKQQVKTRKGG